MTHAIMVLQQEHKGMARLLSLMEKLLSDIDEGGSPDTNLMLEIGEYLSGYPEQCHHPKEDLIFRKLQAKDPDAQISRVDLLHEHAQLSELIDSFTDSLSGLDDSADSRQSGLAQAMRELIAAYKHHMDMEETHFFPLATSRLSADDWAEIDFAVSEQDDPLLDAASTKYSRLRDEIFRLAEQHDKVGTSAVPAAEAFDNIGNSTTVEQFDETMKELGIRLTMGRRRDGGYFLSDGQHCVFEIPVGEEGYAVWCAFGFAVGRSS
jgi:hemerythrin-like domain-containing protein